MHSYATRISLQSDSTSEDNFPRRPDKCLCVVAHSGGLHTCLFILGGKAFTATST